MKIYLLFFVLIIFLISGCSQNSPAYSNLTRTQDPRSSGYELLAYAEQYRDISSLMIQRNLERDFVSLENLLKEALNISDKVQGLSVTSRYTEAKEFLMGWMVNDSLHYYLILQDGSKELIQVSSDKSIQDYLLFLDEMIELGHDIK